MVKLSRDLQRFEAQIAAEKDLLEEIQTVLDLQMPPSQERISSHAKEHDKLGADKLAAKPVF